MLYIHTPKTFLNAENCVQKTVLCAASCKFMRRALIRAVMINGLFLER